MGQSADLPDWLVGVADLASDERPARPRRRAGAGSRHRRPLLYRRNLARRDREVVEPALTLPPCAPRARSRRAFSQAFTAMNVARSLVAFVILILARGRPRPKARKRSRSLSRRSR